MAAERDADALPALWFAPVACRPLVLRPVGAGDAAAFGDFVKALSPLSRLRRFHVGLTELPPSWLQQMTRPDPATELALVAIASCDGRPVCVAEARYARDDDSDAWQREFALVVADAWQRQGLGRELLRRLVAHAAGRSVRRLVGDVLRDNAPMLRLVQHAGFSVRTHPGDGRLLRAALTLDLPRDVAADAAQPSAAGVAARATVSPR